MCLLCVLGAAGPGEEEEEPGVVVADPPPAGSERALLAYLDSSGARWNALTDLKTPVIVTYSFLSQRELPSLSEFNPYDSDSYAPFSDAQRAEFRKAAEIAMQTAGVVLVESDADGAMIDIYNSTGSSYAGWAHYPAVSKWGTTGGDLVLDFASGASYAPGTFAFEAMLHELGHALGLKHPFEGDIKLPRQYDNTSNTLMSYTHSDNGYFTDYRSLDAAALTRLYGDPVNTRGWQITADGAGVTLKMTGRAETVVGPIGDSTLSGMGGADTIIGGSGYDVIRGGNGADVLKDTNGRLYGGDGYDIVTGGAADEMLFGGAGQDTLWGGDGSDTLRGGAGIDSLSADRSAMHGYIASDLLRGDAGHDYLRSGGGNDTLLGGTGLDHLVLDTRSWGHSILSGGGGDDVLAVRRLGSADVSGGKGDDELRLNGASHVVVIDPDYDRGSDRVIGFDLVNDSIRIDGEADPVFSRHAGRLELSIGEAHLRFTNLVWADRDQIIFT